MRLTLAAASLLSWFLWTLEGVAVVSTIIFCVLFVSFSYCGDCYFHISFLFLTSWLFKKSSCRDWKFTLQGWGFDFLYVLETKTKVSAWNLFFLKQMLYWNSTRTFLEQLWLSRKKRKHRRLVPQYENEIKRMQNIIVETTVACFFFIICRMHFEEKM